jgi:hypothetical protein
VHVERQLGEIVAAFHQDVRAAGAPTARRSLSDVTLDEFLERLGEFAAFFGSSPRQFPSDLLRGVPRPALDRIERHDASTSSTSSGRRFSATGLSFGFGWSTRGWRRAFRLRLFRRCCSNWPRKLGCPPLFDLSFKVPRSIAHNPYSGLAILPLAARLNAPAVQRFSRFRVGSGV